MAENHILYNGGISSVVYDAAGHSLDPGDRIEGNPNGRVLSSLLEAGQLTDLGPATEQPGDDDTESDDDSDDSDDGGDEPTF